MRFKWEKYNNTHEELVNSWLDDIAVKFTGLDNGWNEFYSYWMQEAKTNDFCEDFCFIVSECDVPFAVIYAATKLTELTISECIVAPDKRGMGYGSAAIKEFIDNCTALIEKSIVKADAVIYPNNIAAQRAFEKAGFTFVSAHPDGDAWNYEYSVRGYSVIEHYDLLIEENNDPVHDPEPLKKYMDKWDGQDFINCMQLDGSQVVLEIGVGTGRLATRIAPLCAEFTGIDISDKTISRAKENLVDSSNAELICGDFLVYDFNCTFDVIYSSLTFMHIKEKLLAITRVADLLNPAGKFILSIDKNQREYLDYGTRKIKLFPDTPREIISHIASSGLLLIKHYETEFAHIFVAIKDNKCYCDHDC